MKTKTTLAILATAWIALFPGCKKDTFEEIKSLCPIVVSTDPTDQATNVPLNQVITVTFNQIMNPATIDSATIIITGANVLSGAFTINEETVSFMPSTPLDENTTYTGIVKTRAEDELGNALQEDFIWTFSTGIAIRPMVASTDPADNAIGVELDKVISATFNMAMDTTSITTNTFKVRNAGIDVPGSISFNGNTAFLHQAMTWAKK